MHAVLVDDDQSLAWREVADPVAKAGEIVVDIHAAALNRADLLQRAGNYPPPPGWPAVDGPGGGGCGGPGPC